MSQLRNLAIILLIVLTCAVAAQAQDASNAKHFEKDGLTFDYPAQWDLTDDNSQAERTVTIKPAAGATQILVVLYRGPVPSCDFEAEGKKITGALSERVAIVIQAGDAPVSVPVKTTAANSELEGTELQGTIQHRPALGGVYSIRRNRQFVSLIFVRQVEDESAAAAWELFRTSLRVETSTMGVIAVITAHAVSVHPLLLAESVAAARGARFSPTKLCGEPVKVTGVITYNFVAR